MVDINEQLIEELNRYQDMTKEVLDYIMANLDKSECQQILDIIKKWCC